MLRRPKPLASALSTTLCWPYWSFSKFTRGTSPVFFVQSLVNCCPWLSLRHILSSELHVLRFLGSPVIKVCHLQAPYVYCTTCITPRDNKCKFSLSSASPAFKSHIKLPPQHQLASNHYRSLLAELHKVLLLCKSAFDSMHK